MQLDYLSEDCSAIWVTVPAIEDARLIAKTLVEEKLAACVSIIPEIISTYRWQGKVEEYSEVKLLVKTKSNLFDEVANRVKKIHPATLPEIISLKIEQTTEDYQAWLLNETKEPNDE